MKGQYLVIESVFTLGMGIAIATGTLTLFSDYRENVIESGERKQAIIIGSKIKKHINTLKKVERGQEYLDLSKKIGNNQYRIKIDKNLTIISEEGKYYLKLNDHRFDYSGNVRGGPIKLFKNGQQIKMRPQ